MSLNLFSLNLNELVSENNRLAIFMHDIANWSAETGKDKQAFDNFRKNKLGKILNYLNDAYYIGGKSPSDKEKNKRVKNRENIRSLSVSEFTRLSNFSTISS